MNYLADNKHNIKFHLLGCQFDLVSLELYKFFSMGHKSVWHFQVYVLSINILFHEQVCLI